MRTIKFRAWEKRQKIMCFNFSLYIDSTEKAKISFADWVNQDDYEIMQFTGLYDGTKFEDLTPQEQNEWLKNNKQEDWKGKEIYEGDIVRFDHYPGENYVGEVYFCETNLAYYLELHRVTNQVSGRAIGNMLTDYDDSTIIGNIYENPELLKD